MEKLVNKDILNIVDDIVATIKESNEYQEYQQLSEKLKENQKVNVLISKVKSLQKEVVRKKSCKEDVENLEKQITSYLEELDNIPLYTEFVEKQKYLNGIYQMIKERLDDYFDQVLN